MMHWKSTLRKSSLNACVARVLVWTALALISIGTGQVLAAEPGNASTAGSLPNIVWIFVEDTNPWMGCYGDKTVPTPNIDWLASQGVRFTRAYMPSAVCSPTRSAIALGAMQTSLGVHNHRSSRRRVPEEVIYLPEGVKTVYELMREAGYYVTSVQGKNDFNFVWRPEDLYDYVVPTNWGFSPDQWRRRPKGKPFFAQIQLAGGKNTGRFAGAPADSNGPFTDLSKVQVAPYYPDHPIIRREYAHHYDTIRQTDDEVGEILSALKADGLLENTVIFFFSDHGMRLPRHKQFLYEGGIRVPFIVAGPGLPKGQVRDDLVSGIDITVTTLSLAGVKPGSWMEGRDIFAPDYQPREYVIAARDRCDFTIDRIRAVVTQRYKYIRNFMTDRPLMQPQYRDGSDYLEIGRQLYREGKLNEVQSFIWLPTRVPEEFYDLENDPHETKNLVNDPAYAAELERHRKLLEDWIKSTDDKGQYPEPIESLRGVLVEWAEKAVNPEYEKARAGFDLEKARAARKRK